MGKRRHRGSGGSNAAGSFNIRRFNIRKALSTEEILDIPPTKILRVELPARDRKAGK